MAHVAKIGHVAFHTTNLDRLLAYYTDVLGLTLTARGGDGTAYLSCGVDHHSVILTPATENRLHHVAFQLDQSISLREAARQLHEAGIESGLMSDAQPGIPELLQLSDPDEIEFSSDMYIITNSVAEQYKAEQQRRVIEVSPAQPVPVPTSGSIHEKSATFDTKPANSTLPTDKTTDSAFDGRSLTEQRADTEEKVKHLSWAGEIPMVRWSNFYYRILSGFASSGSVKLTL